MNLWCWKLWVNRQCLDAPLMSHSQLLEWISGSFIQSHWPCMTLWPISMFSMILATPNVTVPAHQAVRRELAASNSRPASSRPRCAAMVRRM
ncbi:hypothetical protein C1Y40_03065 [Mycobacterium talmoniae]|uniref:Uncharacterized protein n=1 Tax=Mycobacterium talmoniae TaxID=1858794 RepID=A0A2S8BJH0_9MYCO|nr:hypothetical protein C1Y40_03065 [Mycobacterium talmoniae]